MVDEDFALALHLQEELDLQDGCDFAKCSPVDYNEKSVTDSSWELIDPNPDPRALFIEFNNKFFWRKLDGVEVRWSPRMTLCAGVCVYEGRGGLCSIRLSEPLLKLRPRKDLVETLLHEMIHAYLFVTNNNKDRDGHGPEFLSHMHRLNKMTGAHITVYHNFNDEVENYRTHWWRCSGPCMNRKPFFGYVKRAMNRPPSSRDPWWTEHQNTCGGIFTKIKEPDGYGANKTKKLQQISRKAGENVVNKSLLLSWMQNTSSFSGNSFHLKSVPGETRKISDPNGYSKPVAVGDDIDANSLSTDAVFPVLKKLKLDLADNKKQKSANTDMILANFSNESKLMDEHFMSEIISHDEDIKQSYSGDPPCDKQSVKECQPHRLVIPEKVDVPGSSLFSRGLSDTAKMSLVNIKTCLSNDKLEVGSVIRLSSFKSVCSPNCRLQKDPVNLVDVTSYGRKASLNSDNSFAMDSSFNSYEKKLNHDKQKYAGVANNIISEKINGVLCDNVKIASGNSFSVLSHEEFSFDENKTIAHMINQIRESGGYAL